LLVFVLSDFVVLTARIDQRTIVKVKVISVHIYN